MHKKVAFGLLSLCILIAISTLSYAQSKKAQRRRTTTGGANLLKLISCCDDLKELKVQVANLTSILTDLSKKQETDWINVVMQVMDLEGNYRQVESRITEAEGKYSEMNNRIDIMQLQAAQTVTQTSADAVYDCSSLYHRSYKISGVYKLPADEFLGTPELEDWNGNLRYAEYNSFSLGNELNSYRLFLGDYTGNAGRDSLRYHNNTAFSTKDKDNDKCVDDCAEFRKGGYWYNCCTDSNLNGVYYRHGEHTKHSDGISWYGWHGSSYSLKQVEMKIRPQNFTP
ncbi:angiopoietin-related protein 7 isoform X2 [Latimeria chalumnae]|uniref:angiopoietin-related protein 7 isoform X2 n=1 Tax=Latimeria chalumnae TaxID=7897 RepID=UPI0003C1A943|nr:PREDICTED: angiopoietin-related protein 7 isoform X2 [Latimeria chalumnae]|eukprot:XP_005994068.1 PREDICTED: angiopoietin-related protein 7 isoform X2 [Latimeria chalumnae]